MKKVSKLKKLINEKNIIWNIYMNNEKRDEMKQRKKKVLST